MRGSAPARASARAPVRSVEASSTMMISWSGVISASAAPAARMARWMYASSLYMGKTMLMDATMRQRLPRKAGAECYTLRATEDSMDHLSQAVIEEVRDRLTRGFPQQVR